MGDRRLILLVGAIVAIVVLANVALSAPAITLPKFWWTSPSFQSDILPIFERRCLMCHGKQGAAPAFAQPENVQSKECFTCHTTSLSPDLKVYDRFISHHSTCEDLPLIVAGKPESSYLIEKITTTPPRCGEKMPPGSRLPEEELALIRNWIATGARE